ncbi:MAG TPA: GDP-mannose 4,6-dehydratase [Ktedonobacterales bacterium]|nr:GDP-mannose 4,6-dehydratase [Ktedonobacterales bacterium]
MSHTLHEPERILITGYGGFVAPYLARSCARRYPQAHIYGLVHEASLPPRPALPPDEPPGAPRGEREDEQSIPVVTAVAGDITDGARLRAVLLETRPDVIFHLAAASSVAVSWQQPAEVLRVNAGGFIQLAESVRTLRAEGIAPRIVVSGSGEQYGLVRPEENPIAEDTLPRPNNPYAVSKVAQDLTAFAYHRAYGLDVIRARAFNHFGPGQRDDFVIPSFARQIAQIEAGRAEPVIHVGNLSAQRDFLPVEDVVAAYVTLAEYGQAGEAYNVGAGSALSIEDMLQRLLKTARATIAVRVDPARFRPADVPVLCADTTRITRDTPWRPSGALDASLQATLDYWRRVEAPPVPPL